MKSYIIIPAYNEENNIFQTTKDLLENGFDNIIVVDDCSSDNTLKVLNNLNIIKLEHVINRGQGASLRTGTKKAIEDGAEIIIHFDGDGQFLASDINNVIEPILNNDADIVFGSRFLGQSLKMPKIKKYFLMPFAKFFNKLFLNIKLTDPQSGFRAFRADIFEKINWEQDRMAHCSEILHLAHKRNLRIEERPITVIYKEHGTNFLGGLRIIEELFLGKLIK
jgi:glycosyltransferase involved in cell wall biosynthesis